MAAAISEIPVSMDFRFQKIVYCNNQAELDYVKEAFPTCLIFPSGDVGVAMMPETARQLGLNLSHE